MFLSFLSIAHSTDLDSTIALSLCIFSLWIVIYLTICEPNILFIWPLVIKINYDSVNQFLTQQQLQEVFWII